MGKNIFKILRRKKNVYQKLWYIVPVVYGLYPYPLHQSLWQVGPGETYQLPANPCSESAVGLRRNCSICWDSQQQRQGR